MSLHGLQFIAFAELNLVEGQMATTSDQHDTHQKTLQIARLRALRFVLICGAIVLSGSGCVGPARDNFGTSAFNAVPYQMPSSAVP